VAKAERSHGLWATINICNTRKHPDVFGIRGQIPALGFPASVKMTITPEYYSVATGRMRPLEHGARIPARTIATGFVQEGTSFKILTPPAVLGGKITFTWSAGPKLTASTTRKTTSGVKGVQQSDPAGYSASDCRIGE
jgi:hypothetical protein